MAREAREAWDEAFSIDSDDGDDGDDGDSKTDSKSEHELRQVMKDEFELCSEQTTEQVADWLQLEHAAVFWNVVDLPFETRHVPSYEPWVHAKAAVAIARVQAEWAKPPPSPPRPRLTR